MSVPLSECRSPILKLATYFRSNTEVWLWFWRGGGAAGRDLSCVVCPTVKRMHPKVDIFAIPSYADDMLCSIAACHVIFGMQSIVDAESSYNR